MNLLHKCNVSYTARFAFIAQLSCLIFQIRVNIVGRILKSFL